MQSLPDDPEALRALLAATLAKCEALIEERDTLAARNERLRHLLDKLQRMRFGRRSEQLPEDQLQFAFEEVEASLAGNEAEAEKGSPELRKTNTAKRRAGRGRLPELAVELRLGKIRRPGLATSSPASPTIPPQSSTNFYPGTGSHRRCRSQPPPDRQPRYSPNGYANPPEQFGSGRRKTNLGYEKIADRSGWLFVCNPHERGRSQRNRLCVTIFPNPICRGLSQNCESSPLTHWEKAKDMVRAFQTRQSEF